MHVIPCLCILYILYVHRNPQNDLQAQARAHRIGQVHKQCTIYTYTLVTLYPYFACIQIFYYIYSNVLLYIFIYYTIYIHINSSTPLPFLTWPNPHLTYTYRLSRWRCIGYWHAKLTVYIYIYTHLTLAYNTYICTRILPRLHIWHICIYDALVYMTNTYM